MLNRDEADKFSKFIHENLAALLNVPEDNLIEVLRKYSVEAVFVRSITEQEKLRAYLSHHNILNVETCILSAIGINSYDGNVLVPVMPSNGKQRRFLSQTKISDRLLINFTMLEEKDFKRSVSAAVKWQSALEQANKQTFQNTRTVKRLPKEPEIDFEQALQQKIADTDNELLNAIRINAGRNANASPSVRRDVADACVYQIADEDLVVFHPKQSNLL